MKLWWPWSLRKRVRDRMQSVPTTQAIPVGRITINIPDLRNGYRKVDS